MKLISTAIIMGLICGVVAEDKKAMKKEAKKEIVATKEKGLEVKDLPEKVQASIKEVCKGEITKVQAIKAGEKTSYKVFAKADKKNTVYMFDEEGKTIK